MRGEEHFIPEKCGLFVKMQRLSIRRRSNVIYKDEFSDSCPIPKKDKDVETRRKSLIDHRHSDPECKHSVTYKNEKEEKAIVHSSSRRGSCVMYKDEVIKTIEKEQYSKSDIISPQPRPRRKSSVIYKDESDLLIVSENLRKK